MIAVTVGTGLTLIAVLSVVTVGHRTIFYDFLKQQHENYSKLSYTICTKVQNNY